MGDFSYEHLFDVLQRERKREELQLLEKEFYPMANEYIESQSAIVRNFDVLSDQSDKSRQQLQNAKKLLKELYDRREKKILLLALNKAKTNSNIIDTSSLLPNEQDMFEHIVSLLQTKRQSFSAITNGTAPLPKPAPKAQPSDTKPAPVTKAPAPEKKPEEKLQDDGIKVKLTADVPKFMGSANETFGPFKEGDEALLPERIAQILVKKGRAEHA